jgi:hypothetical protein
MTTSLDQSRDSTISSYVAKEVVNMNGKGRAVQAAHFLNLRRFLHNGYGIILAKAIVNLHTIYTRTSVHWRLPAKNPEWRQATK